MRVLREMTGVELKLFVREPVTVVFVLVLPLVVLVILNGIFGNAPAEFSRGWARSTTTPPLMSR